MIIDDVQQIFFQFIVPLNIYTVFLSIYMSNFWFSKSLDNPFMSLCIDMATEWCSKKYFSEDEKIGLVKPDRWESYSLRDTMSPISQSKTSQILQRIVRVTGSSRRSRVMVLGAILAARRKSAGSIFLSISSFQSRLYETHMTHNSLCSLPIRDIPWSAPFIQHGT